MVGKSPRKSGKSSLSAGGLEIRERFRCPHRFFCDMSALRTRYDINPQRPAGHIASKIYRMPWRISQISQGIYIAANKKSPGKIREILLLAISPDGGLCCIAQKGEINHLDCNGHSFGLQP